MKKLTWDDVSIGKFQKMQLIQEVDSGNVERYIELIGLLFDLGDPGETTIEEYRVYLSCLDAIQTLPEMAKEVPEFRTVNGKKFKLLRDVNKMTGGEFIDFSVIRKKKNFADTLAVLYRNEKMSFAERSDWIREHETVQGAYPYLSFFLLCTKESLKRIQAYSLGQKMRTRKTPLRS